MRDKGSITDAVLLTAFVVILTAALLLYVLPDRFSFKFALSQGTSTSDNPSPAPQEIEEKPLPPTQEPKDVAPALTTEDMSVSDDKVKKGQGSACLVASAPISSPYSIGYYLKNSENIKYLSIEINSVPVEAIFDTGASFVSVGSDVIRSLGVQSFNRIENAVTPGGAAVSYSFICESIKVGGIEVKNVRCVYIPAMRGTLLGGSFLSLFNYSVDENNRAITFSPR